MTHCNARTRLCVVRLKHFAQNMLQASALGVGVPKKRAYIPCFPNVMGSPRDVCIVAAVRTPLGGETGHLARA